MKHFYTVALVAVLLSSQGRAGGNDPIDYRYVAAGANWVWRPDMADPLDCMGASQRDFTYSIKYVPGQPGLVFSVRRGDKELYKWTGHRRSVFIVRAGILYYAVFTPTEMGGTIIAVDLSNGTQLWRERLVAAEPRGYTTPQPTLMILEVNDAVLGIWGTETCGEYLEYKDIKTGKTIANRRFTEKEVKVGNSNNGYLEKKPSHE